MQSQSRHLCAIVVLIRVEASSAVVASLAVFLIAWTTGHCRRHVLDVAGDLAPENGLAA